MVEYPCHLLENLLHFGFSTLDVRPCPGNVFAGTAQKGRGLRNTAGGQIQQLLSHISRCLAIFPLEKLVVLQVLQQPFNFTRRIGNQAAGPTLTMLFGAQLIAYTQHVGCFRHCETVKGD